MREIGVMNWEFGFSRCKLVYTGWVKNKDVQHSTENYIQHPVINCNEEECEKEYVCITESLCCIEEIMQHCKSTIGLPWCLSGKRICLLRQETWVRSLGWEDPLEKEMATHSSILAWEIPRTE